MSDTVIFAVIFVGFFVLRGVAATVIFFYILPAGDRCPNCDAVTLRVESRVWNAMLPWFRTSWCFECGWHGMLRRGPLSPAPTTAELTKLS
jgi:hypothetical protein